MVSEQVQQPVSTRAGRYVRQPAGYSAFIPAPLPPIPAIDVAGMLALLSKADRAHTSANNLVANLQQAEILREITGQRRNRRFAYEPYIQLFRD